MGGVSIFLNEITHDGRKKTRVLCVDDHPDTVRLICDFINQQQDLEAVGNLHRADELVDQVEKLGADVVLLDYSMPGANPMDAMIQTIARCPEVCFLILSAYDVAAHRSRALQNGASAYFIKDGNIESLLRAIRRTGKKA